MSFENLKFLAYTEPILKRGVLYPAELSMVAIHSTERMEQFLWCVDIRDFYFSMQDLEYNYHKSPVLYPQAIETLTVRRRGLDYEVKIPPNSRYSGSTSELISFGEMTELGFQLCGDCRLVGCFGEEQEGFLRDYWGFRALMDIEPRLRPVWKSEILPALERARRDAPDIYFTPAVGMAKYIMELNSVVEEKPRSCKPM